MKYRCGAHRDFGIGGIEIQSNKLLLWVRDGIILIVGIKRFSIFLV